MIDMLDAATLVDVVIGFTLVEAAAIVVLRRRHGTDALLPGVLPNIAAGLCLMLALRCQVHETGIAAVGACLFAAGVVHVAELARRWRLGAGRGVDRRVSA